MLSNAERGRHPINWASLAAEGAAIVASILLAFTIDAWWQNVQDRSLEVESLEAVLAEFEANRDLLPGYIGRHRHMVDGLAEVHRLYDETEPGALFEVTDTLLLRPVAPISFDPRQGALSALLASGDLRHIRNPDLREALAAWPSNVADATENESMLSRDQRPPLIDVLASQVDIARILRVFARDGSMESQGTIALHATTELASRMRMVQMYSQAARRELGELLVEAESIIALLREELKR